jgi:hypothetical protein
MATLNEIAYDLLTIVRPHLSDDSDLDIRQIKYWIRNQRALWVRQELNKKRTADAELIQTICADLEEVDPSDCCDIEIGCDILLRTTKEIPSTIELYNKEAILRVSGVNKIKKPFSYVEYARIPWVGNGRFNKNNIYAFLHEKYMYIYSPGNPEWKFLENISIRGVFEDPEEASKFKDCNTGETCYSDDDPYPMKSWMLPAMKEAILKSNLMIQAQAEQAQDESNNAASDIKPAAQ